MTLSEHLDLLEKLVIDRAPVGDIRAQIATIREHLEAVEASHIEFASQHAELEEDHSQLVQQNLAMEAELSTLKREAHSVVVTYIDGEIKEYPGDAAVLEGEWYEIRKHRRDQQTFTVLQRIRASQVRDIKNPLS